MNKIVLLGTKTIYLADNDVLPQPDTDYFLTLVVARDSVKENDLHGDPPPADKVFFLKVQYPEKLVAKGKTAIPITKSRSQSQVLRFTLEDLAEQQGKEKEKFYQDEMSKIITHYKNKLK